MIYIHGKIVDPRELDKTAFAQAQQRQSVTQPIINTVTQTVQLFDNSPIPFWDSFIICSLPMAIHSNKPNLNYNR